VTGESHRPTAQEPASIYPAGAKIDYFDGERDRLTVFFRLFTVIPILIVLGTIVGAYGHTESYTGTNYSWNSQTGYAVGGVSILFWPVMLMILFRRKYPRWWFDFNLELLKFSTRVGAYFCLLTDKYPSTDEEQSVHVTLEYPDATRLNRWLPLVKWFLAIPHYIVLIVLSLVGLALLILGWFAVLFTGKFPRGIHEFLVSLTRWSIRVQAYALFLTTDEYPPFSFD
jgi:hypothetical protein